MHLLLFFCSRPSQYMALWATEAHTNCRLPLCADGEYVLFFAMITALFRFRIHNVCLSFVAFHLWRAPWDATQHCFRHLTYKHKVILACCVRAQKTADRKRKFPGDPPTWCSTRGEVTSLRDRMHTVTPVKFGAVPEKLASWPMHFRARCRTLFYSVGVKYSCLVSRRWTPCCGEENVAKALAVLWHRSHVTSIYRVFCVSHVKTPECLYPNIKDQ